MLWAREVPEASRSSHYVYIDFVSQHDEVCLDQSNKINAEFNIFSESITLVHTASHLVNMQHMKLALAARQSLQSNSRASNTLKINNRVIPKNLRLGHDVKMIPISIVVGVSLLRAPLSIPIVGAQVGKHNNHRVSSLTTCSLARGCFARRGELVALSAPAAAPASAAKEGGRSSGGVDSGSDAQLP